METRRTILRYLKLAIPALAIVALLHILFTPGSSLNYKMKTWTRSYPLEFFLAERGGGKRDGAHGQEYYEALQLKVYDRDQASKVTLKRFAVDHVRHWEAAVFLGLVEDWSALDLPDLQSFC